MRATGGTALPFKHIGLVCLPAGLSAALSGAAGGAARSDERLEQLRALENGFKIRVVETDYESIGVDTPEDLERVRELLQASDAGGRSDPRRMAKFIFVTGGVVSSLGKGIAAASIGCLLESRGLTVIAAEVRSLSERRSGHDEPVSARRGFRHR